MKKKTPIEMKRYRAAKITRNLIRLKYSLAADEEINEVLSDRLSSFDEAILQGELKELQADLTEVLKEL